MAFVQIKRPIRGGTLDVDNKEKAERTQEKKKSVLKPQIERALKLQRLFSANDHGLGISSDGKVFTDEHNVTFIDDIVACSVSSLCDLFLKSDGTCIVKKKNNYSRFLEEINTWTDIVAISVSDNHAVGLKSDGTVVVVGFNGYGQCDILGWTDIVAISAAGNRTVGLKSDGTVVSVGPYQGLGSIITDCNASSWRDIVAISASGAHTVGLKSDGTVVADGLMNCYMNFYNSQESRLSDWKNIIAVSAGSLCTVGLKSDGTVVAIGNVDSTELFFLEKWTDIVAISAGDAGRHDIMGLKSDGAVVVASPYNSTRNWKLFNDINNIEEERRLSKIERELKQKEEYRVKGCCQHCGGVFKGFFTKKCINCGKSKDY